MNVALLAQEEPAYVGPMLIEFMQRERQHIGFVAVAPMRGAGARTDTVMHSLEDTLSTILIFGADGMKHLLKSRAAYKTRNADDAQGDCSSITRAATRLHIPTIEIASVQDPALRTALHDMAPDVIMNQTEQYIDKELRNLPKKGVINRHGSLLPKHRGRLASFWSHIDGEYGVTIHYVTAKIDAGPIIYQKRLNLDPTASYHHIISEIFRASSAALSEGLRRVEDPGFMPTPQPIEGVQHPFPTLRDALRYRRILHLRRTA